MTSMELGTELHRIVTDPANFGGIMISESRHTPGPWRTGREDVQSYNGATGQPFSSVYADDAQARAGRHLGHKLPLVIATVHGDHIGETEEKDNARLIAAAPELLEACESAAEFINNGTPIRQWSDVANAILAAIAKARGS